MVKCYTGEAKYLVHDLWGLQDLVLIQMNKYNYNSV